MSNSELDARIKTFLKTKFKQFPELEGDLSDKTQRWQPEKPRRQLGSWRPSRLFG